MLKSFSRYQILKGYLLKLIGGEATRIFIASIIWIFLQFEGFLIQEIFVRIFLSLECGKFLNLERGTFVDIFLNLNFETFLNLDCRV